MHIPYVLTNLGKLKLLAAYTVAYIRSLINNVTSQATRFVVSVPAQEFHFSSTPQLYKYRNENLGSRLNTKYFHIYIPIYILPYQSYSKVNTSHIYI